METALSTSSSKRQYRPSGGQAPGYADAMLPLTLSWAIEHPFYRAHWGEAASQTFDRAQVDARARLHALPTIDKRNLINDVAPRVQAGDFIASIMHTTGSTGAIAFRYRSELELRQIERLTAATHVESERADGPRKLAMSITAPFHGTEIQLGLRDPRTPFTYTAAIGEDLLIDQAVDMLLRRFELPGIDERITILRGAVRHIRIFTQYLIDANVDRSRLAIRVLGVNTGYVTDQIRDHLSGYWGFAPLDNYSCTEIMGGAVKCPRCGSLPFPPHVVCEIVGLDHHRPLDNGVGRIALTELLPFGLCQPLIRYLNGDIGERIEAGAGCPEHVGEMRQLGRESASFFLRRPDGRELLLGSNAFREAFYTPLVEKRLEASNLTRLRDRTILGPPLVRAALDDTRKPAELFIEYRPGPAARARSPADVAAELMERLTQYSGTLARALDERRVRVKIEPNDNVVETLYK